METFENKEDCRKESVKIPEGDINLSGTMFYPKEPKERSPATLFVHGWFSKQQTLWNIAEELARRGEISLTFDLREHGIEGGDPKKLSRKEYLDDAIAAYDFLSKQKDVDAENISVVGVSLGAYISALLTSKRKVKMLGLRVPADYMDEGFDEAGIKGSEVPDVMEWRKQVRDASNSMALGALNEYDGKVLVIQSGQDTDIPNETIDSYLKAPKNPGQVQYSFMPEVGHSIRTADTKNKDLLRDIICNWKLDNS